MGKSSKRNSDYNKDAPRLKKHAILESPEPEYSSKANFTLNDDSFSLNSSSSSSKDAESTSSVASSSSSSSSQPDDNASSSSASSSSSFFDELVSQVPNSKVASKEKEQPVREATIFNTFATLAQDPPKRAVTLVGTYMTVDRWSDGSFAFVLHGAIDGVVTLILQESEVKRFCRSLQKHDLLVVTDAIVRLAKTGAYVNARLTNSSCVYVCNRAFPDKVTEETQGSKLESMISSSNVELPQLLELNDIYLAQHLTGKSYRMEFFVRVVKDAEQDHFRDCIVRDNKNEEKLLRIFSKNRSTVLELPAFFQAGKTFSFRNVQVNYFRQEYSVKMWVRTGGEIAMVVEGEDSDED